jgi:hypothetical protein
MKNFIALVVVLVVCFCGKDTFGQYAQYDNTGLNIVRVDSGSGFGGGFNQQVGGWQGGFVPQPRIVGGLGGGFVGGVPLPINAPSINLGPIGYDPSLNIIRNRGIIIPPVRVNGFNWVNGFGGGIFRIR